jgi:hypothetical protein
MLDQPITLTVIAGGFQVIVAVYVGVIVRMQQVTNRTPEYQPSPRQ